MLCGLCMMLVVSLWLSLLVGLGGLCGLCGIGFIGLFCISVSIGKMPSLVVLNLLIIVVMIDLCESVILLPTFPSTSNTSYQNQLNKTQATP